MSQYREIANKLSAEGYKFGLSSYLNQGWKLGLQSIGWLILYAIIYIAIWALCRVIPFVGELAYSIVLAPILSAGVTYFLHKKHTTGESDFSTFFYGFKDLGNLVFANFLMGLIVVVAMIPMFLAFLSFFGMELIQAMIGDQDPNEIGNTGSELLSKMGGVGITFFVTFIIVGLILTLLVFTNQFVILGRLSAVDAIKASMQVAKKKVFSIFGFIIVLGLINLLGVLPLGLGLILTLPMTAGAFYFMFKDIVMSQISGDHNILLSEDDILDA